LKSCGRARSEGGGAIVVFDRLKRLGALAQAVKIGTDVLKALNVRDQVSGRLGAQILAV
jgi:hypothetical protein